ncbi:MAG TPA: MBL fold metallo-hydrolase [Pseudomonadales bacterium]|nr:MBL fold metallo-hydrolase [Pseudomonadales bacterium]
MKKNFSKQNRQTKTDITHHLPRVTFLGAARQVTGSCHLLEVCGMRILLDCGMQQGGDSKINDASKPDVGHDFSFDIDPSTVDAVILSHAHLDHSGMLPLLVHRGFNGAIYCTSGTRNLLDILLMDSFHLYSKDLEYENLRRERAGRKTLPPLYTERDVKHVIDLCDCCEYGQKRNIADGITLSLHDAGHILGSSIVELRIADGTRNKTLVFSGDLGNDSTSLMKDPEVVENADLVLMESTYGDRNHRSFDATMEEFTQILQQVQHERGNILIPAFAVGRTQELIFQLGKLYHQGKLQNWVVFLDSPMGRAVTDVYSHSLGRLDPSDTALLKKYKSKSLTDFLPCLSITESVEDSMAINRVKSGAIIIAGSGMCTGGRIRHHFKHRLWHENTHVIFTGYQARGTLGRILIHKPKTVKLQGQMIAVKAQIHTLGGFSAHADQTQLLEWATQFKNKPPFYLVHGEDMALTALQEELSIRKIHADIAEPGNSVTF